MERRVLAEGYWLSRRADEDVDGPAMDELAAYVWNELPGALQAGQDERLCDWMLEQFGSVAPSREQHPRCDPDRVV